MRKLALVLMVATLLVTSCKKEEGAGTGGDTAAFIDTAGTSTSTATTSSAASATEATTDTTKTDTATTKTAK